MTTQEGSDEADIRQLIDKLADSIRTRDIERLKTCFASDIVSFDAGPRLQDRGSQAKLKNWNDAFTVLQPPLDYEIRDLTITVGADVSFAHGLNRLSGTLDGNRFGAWVRWTAGLRKINGTWLIAHDQVSVPVDFVSAKALLNLEPESSRLSR